MSERALVIECAGAELVGILHAPASRPVAGVVIVVGGPQYRVGSHRQFVLLARALAEGEVACLRFDCRGMGDSGGDFPGFEQIEPDVRAAVDCLLAQCPELERVHLWGLCDAAAAIAMYAWRDPRIAGIAIANPWVRSAAGQAQVILEQYYLRRITSAEFWRKLFCGRLGIIRAARDLLQNWALARGSRPGGRTAGKSGPFQERMLHGLQRFAGPVLLITSGEDLTAAEFIQLVSSSTGWQRALERAGVERQHLPAANHTFSSDRWRRQVELWTLAWLKTDAR
jgi:exosortase A-associated hydrolase 1